jgi:hypothetical protein
MKIRVQTFVSACCVSCVATIVTAAREPAQRGHGGGSATGSASASGRGSQGGPIASRPVSGRPESHAAAPPPRFTTTLAFRPVLASRRITPFAGPRFGGEALALRNRFWWSGFAAGEPVDDSAPFALPDSAPAQVAALVARGASPQASSIQPLEPSVLPSSSASLSANGTLRLDVEPLTAQVYVDGFYVGSVAMVNDLGLTLGVGWHRLEFRAPGYETPAVNVTVEANRTTTYHLALQPAL